MKLTYSSVLLVWVVTVSLCNAALNDQELFLQGHNAYKKMEYQQASQQYNQIKDKGYAVWVNLGNCAYHLGDYPQAYVCWLRAQNDAPFSLQSTIEKNYNLLTTEHDAKLVSQSVCHQIAVRTHPLLIQLCTALFWILLWWLIVSGRWKKQVLMASTIGMLALVCGMFTLMCYKTNSHKYAITSDKVVVYSGPNEQYHAVGEINKMSKVCVQEAHEDWYKIRFGSTVGWILNRDIICV